MFVKYLLFFFWKLSKIIDGIKRIFRHILLFLFERMLFEILFNLFDPNVSDKKKYILLFLLSKSYTVWYKRILYRLQKVQVACGLWFLVSIICLSSLINLLPFDILSINRSPDTNLLIQLKASISLS